MRDAPAFSRSPVRSLPNAAYPMIANAPNETATKAIAIKIDQTSSRRGLTLTMYRRAYAPSRFESFD
jgi:hypothetical protein